MPDPPGGTPQKMEETLMILLLTTTKYDAFEYTLLIMKQ
jgi:hypothetical protein